MCPTSNRRTRAVADLADHPARRLLDQDVSVTINTDNPGLFAIDLTGELEVCVDVLGFSDDDVRRVTANAHRRELRRRRGQGRRAPAALRMGGRVGQRSALSAFH